MISLFLLDLYLYSSFEDGIVCHKSDNFQKEKIILTSGF